MKKFLTLSLVAVMTLAVVGCSKKAVTTPGGIESSDVSINKAIQPYESKNDGFSLEFPGERTFQENVFGSSVMFFTPQASGDAVRENVGVIKTPLNKATTLDEYYTLTKPELAKQIKDFKEISNENIKINKMDAKKLIYQGSQGDIKLQWQQTYLIKDSNVYVITYTATIDTFDEYLKPVNKLIASFQVK